MSGSPAAGFAALPTLQADTDSLGSSTWAARGEADVITWLSRLPLHNGFDLVGLLPGPGLVVLQRRSRLAWSLSQRVNQWVRTRAGQARLPLARIGRWRWAEAGQPGNTGVECALAYYTDTRAAACAADIKQNKLRLPPTDFLISYPPDLLMDVGATGVDGPRRQVLAGLGAREYWHIDRPDGTLSVQCWDLSRGPDQRQGESQVLENLSVGALRAALTETAPMAL